MRPKCRQIFRRCKFRKMASNFNLASEQKATNYVSKMNFIGFVCPDFWPGDKWLNGIFTFSPRFFKDGWTLMPLKVNESINQHGDHKWLENWPGSNSSYLWCHHPGYLLTLWRHLGTFGANLVCLLFLECPSFIFASANNQLVHSTLKSSKLRTISWFSYLISLLAQWRTAERA